MKRRSVSSIDSTKMDREHAAPLLEEERNSQDIELSSLHSSPSSPLVDQPLPLHHEPPVPAVPKTKTSYIAIAAALVVTVLGFTVNTESTAYVEDSLDWRKPFCTMYITHSSLCLPWICHLAWSRYKARKKPYKAWVRDYNNSLRESVASIDAYATSGSKYIIKRKGNVGGPLDFLATTMGLVTVVLTVSGCSWFASLAMTTPADLTAIYNCSTFFAAAFSVPLLKERLGWVAITAVAMSIIGTFVIAYGDTTAEHEESAVGASRLLGNLTATIGAVAFGLYEVLFKKWACSSKPMPPAQSLPLTFAASALTGIFTFATLWIGLVVLHVTGVEEFVVPGPYVCLWIFIAVISGCSEYIR
jgi:drug/metabolite transporter (DMT)-like permease